jgi:hypothetical protein
MIRWFLADLIGTHILSMESRKIQKKFLYDLSKLVMKEIKSQTFNLEKCKTELTSTLNIGDEDKVNLILDFIKRERERYYIMIEECFEIKKVKDEEAARKRQEAKKKKEQENLDEKKSKKPRTEKKRERGFAQDPL